MRSAASLRMRAAAPMLTPRFTQASDIILNLAQGYGDP